MPRGSNSEVEVSRVKSKEMNDYSDGKKGAGTRRDEKPGFHGTQKNSKNPPKP